MQKKWPENKEGTTTNRAPAKHWSRKFPQTLELRLDGSMASRNLFGAKSKNQRQSFSSKFFDLSAFLFAFVPNPYLCSSFRLCKLFRGLTVSDCCDCYMLSIYPPMGKSCGVHAHDCTCIYVVECNMIGEIKDIHLSVPKLKNSQDPPPTTLQRG